MTLQIYLQCFIAGVIGQIFHVCVVKLPAAHKRAKAANVPFSILSYLREDWVALTGNFAAILLCVYIVDEAVAVRPNILSFIKCIFILVGFTGSSLLFAALGKSDKLVRKIIDKKTDIADGV